MRRRSKRIRGVVCFFIRCFVRGVVGCVVRCVVRGVFHCFVRGAVRYFSQFVCCYVRGVVCCVVPCDLRSLRYLVASFVFRRSCHCCYCASSFNDCLTSLPPCTAVFVVDVPTFECLRIRIATAATLPAAEAVSSSTLSSCSVSCCTTHKQSGIQADATNSKNAIVALSMDVV